MKLRLLILTAIAVVSLAFGVSVQPVLAATDNASAPPILIEPGNGPPVGGVTPQPTPTPTGNQTVKFKDVTVWVNPEYDDPRLLVMMQGQLDSVTAPVTVKFLVPTASTMYSAGSKDPTGKYTGGPPNRVASQIQGWDEISYTLTQNVFRVEYYDPTIPSTPDKKFSYDFRTVSPISNLTVFVQQPKQSSNYVVTPKGTPGVDGEGFNIFTYNYSNLTSDSQPVHFDISYTRTVTTPSLTSGSGSSNLGLIFGIIIIVVVIGGGALWLLKSRQSHYVPVRRSRKQERRSAKRGGQGTKFCTKCGAPAGASDKFCPSCGSKLRDSA